MNVVLSSSKKTWLSPLFSISFTIEWAYHWLIRKATNRNQYEICIIWLMILCLLSFRLWRNSNKKNSKTDLQGIWSVKIAILYLLFNSWPETNGISCWTRFYFVIRWEKLDFLLYRLIIYSKKKKLNLQLYSKMIGQSTEYKSFSYIFSFI